MLMTEAGCVMNTHFGVDKGHYVFGILLGLFNVLKLMSKVNYEKN